MTEIIEELLASPIIKSFIEGLVIKIVADIWHRRTTNAAFLQSSDSAFAQLATAKTPEEQQNAQRAFQSLLSGS